MRWASSGSGPAELVVGAAGLRRARSTRFWSWPRRPVVADHDVELAVGAEAQDAAVVVAAGCSVGAVGVRLERAQPDQVPVERQGAAVPDEAVDAVAEQRDVCASTVVSAPVVLSVQYR